MSDSSHGWQNHGAKLVWTVASLVWIGSLFGLHLYLFFEGVLGQFGGMKKCYFLAQLEHTVYMGQRERRWVAAVGSVQDKQYREMVVSRNKYDVLSKGIKTRAVALEIQIE